MVELSTSLETMPSLEMGEWAVSIEADESDGSFLKLPINFSVITNLDYAEYQIIIKVLKN